MIGIEENISNWILKKVEDAGARGAILGLSGGLDSAVTALLCKRTVPTLALIMDCASAKEDIDLALEIARSYEIPHKLIKLDEVLRALLLAIHTTDVDKETLGNVKARLRMITLYFHANQFNYLVVGTGNKSELSVGYFTKYGDGGVDILPLGDLYKTEVGEIARRMLLSREVIERKPSAGLWEGQTDEGEIGMSYEELDSILIGMPLKGKIEENKVRKIAEMTRISEHKRAKIPIFKVKRPLPD